MTPAPVTKVTFRAARCIGPAVSGPALISDVSFSARYDLDRATGTFSRIGHPLKGNSVSGRILIFRGVQGGVAGAWAFLAMAAIGVAPAGLVFGDVNPVMVQGAVAAGIPILGGIDPRVFSMVKSGDKVDLDPDSCLLTSALEPQTDPH